MCNPIEFKKLIRMKRIFTKAALLLAVCATAFSFTACNDDNDGDGGGKFKSELTGSYVPAFTTMTIPGVVEEPSDFYFVFLPTWSDPENIPAIDLSAAMELPAGTFMMPMNTICGMLQSIVSQIVKGGLVSIDLTNKGAFGASYYDMIIDENDILTSIMAPAFGTELKHFPSTETGAILPEGALGYYTQGGKFYFTVSKAFLKQTGEQMETPMDLIEIIDGMLEQYKGLNIVSTDDYYAVPLKYTKENGVVKLYVDRAMMLPYKPLLVDLLGSLADPDTMMGLDPADIVAKLFDNTSELEIALHLKKK